MKVLFFNCFLKPGEETSNTDALYDRVKEIMREKDPSLKFENVRAADYCLKKQPILAEGNVMS